MKLNYGTPGELKINISYMYQEFCNRILMRATDCAVFGDQVGRMVALKQLSLKLSSRMDDQTKTKIDDIMLKTDKLERRCDELETVLIKVADDEGMLFSRYADEGYEGREDDF